MKQEVTWGTAAALAIVAAVGISSQSGSKPSGAASGSDRAGAIATKKAKAPPKGVPGEVEPQCADSIPLIKHFFLDAEVVGPESCYAEGHRPPAAPLEAAQPDFIIASFPDPLHTHFSLLFDRFIEALQQGLQDEGYQYDSSWLPWETEESSFALLPDQDEVEDRKGKREDQPGILLFRGPGDAPYQKGLVVFIVGEESTRGIHRSQFEHAVDWIKALRGDSQRPSVAMLGPTFSGSFPSLAELLEKTPDVSKWNGESGVSIYSGSTSSRDDGEGFAKLEKTKNIDFRSFVQDDESALEFFCQYLGQRLEDGKVSVKNLAILSEDETAYGNPLARPEAGPPASNAKTRSSTKSPSINDAGHRSNIICPEATHIYYPRDISTLRAAYQNSSMFGSSKQQIDDNAPRKSLPTDLADPSAQQHDTVRTYAGNQTPLSQEAQLLGIVDVLRAHRAEYIVLRSSNNLDPLFLANFLRRDYPEARIVVLNSDLLFQRGQDAMALSGVMTLSTYPLFSWAREWTSFEDHDSHSHRVFPENSSEGTYIASRLLVQNLARANHQTPKLICDLGDKKVNGDVFVPSVRCQPSKEGVPYAPLPDYAPPYWTDAHACDANSSALTCRPVTWLSVITKHGTWPLAALNNRTLLPTTGDSSSEATVVASQQRSGFPDHPRWPAMPRSTRMLLVALCCLALFHFACCRFASFTAKPAFRAHFATGGTRHTELVLIGSYLIALMALFSGWGCGIFSFEPNLPTGTWQVWVVVVSICLIVGAAIAVNISMTRKLNGADESAAPASRSIMVSLLVFAVLLGAFFILWVWPLEDVLRPAGRVFVYWRAMNLTSGVSPIVPYLSLTVGLYFWFWYALHGLALFGPDRPRLPLSANLVVEIPVEPGELKLSMFSQENVAEPAEETARPLALKNVVFTGVVFGVLVTLALGLLHGVPVRSLGATRYGLIFSVVLGFYFSMILAEAWQIWRTWSSARQLLVFLDRLALRRTLSALHGFSWGSVWKMSGNVLDVRYKLLSRQIESLTHLHRSLTLFKKPDTKEEQEAFAGVDLCKQYVDKSRAAGLEFAKWYSTNYKEPEASDLGDFQNFQTQVAETTGVVLSKLLVPASRVERHSLIQVDPEKSDGDRAQGPPPSKNELIRNAEELVCLTYLGFAQNLLGRIRTLVLGGCYLFIALCIAVSSYPFDPRTALSGVLLVLFITFGGIVVFTYADMHRDATLSHVTNTNPGELGSEFWFKMLGYGAAPLLGLLTQVFPEWSGFLFSWLQPGLSSLK